ncbi:MAG: alpha/beta fold hydrolase [Rubrivivax sp.]|nr:alpha/beta fold hydrolase [Rubrivivax sp.]
MRRRVVLAWWTFALLAAALAWLGLEFRRDLQRHAARLAEGSRVVATACGPVEVGFAGPADGPPLLVVHGSGGGFDQGLLLGAGHAARGWRVIAPSRPGYLRTPYPADGDASGERQADGLACLLDTLGVPRVALMGVSAGGVPALHFALRHPQRLAALVLMVPAVHRPDPAVPTPRWALAVLDQVLKADLPFWLLARAAPDAARRLVLATPAAEYAAASEDERRRADALLDSILPVSARRLGLLNDSRLTTGAARVALEAIQVPTLVISARDDGYGTWSSARYSAEHIPGARFLGYARGGHLLLGHEAEVVAAVQALQPLLDEPAPPAGTRQSAR